MPASTQTSHAPPPPPPSSQPQPLTFPPAVFAALQPHLYLLAHLNPTSPSALPLRPNGRPPSSFRPPNLNTSSLAHPSGSALVRTGDTAAICSIRPELLPSTSIPHPPSPPTSLNDHDTQRTETHTLATLNLLVPNIDLATGCHPSFLPSAGPPPPLAQSLSARLLALLLSTHLVPLSSLLITYAPPRESFDPLAEAPDAEPPAEIKGYWVLYIDVLFISLDGNAFDAAWAAVLAALRDAVLPRAWWDADLQRIVCSAEKGEARRIGVRGMPVASTFAVFDGGEGKGGDKERRAWVLADPDAFEEGLCEEMVTVVVDGEGDGREMRLLRVEKSGGGVVGKEAMREVVSLAEGRWREWREVLQGAGS